MNPDLTTPAQRFYDVARDFFASAFPARVASTDVMVLARLFEKFAQEVPRAPKDTETQWHEITGSEPRMYERIYKGAGDHLIVGNVACFKAGMSWMLIVGGRILRQSELYEGPEPLSDAQRACDDFRDRVVAMWDA